MNKLLLIVVFFISLSGCTKEYGAHPFTRLNIPTEGTIRDVSFRVFGKWIVCGGDGETGFVLSSVDGGITWTQINEPFDNAVNAIYFLNNDIGFAADADILIYKTTNGGESWETFYANSWPLTVNRNLRDIWFTNDSTGFVCGGKNLGNGVLYNTNNNGDYWDFREYEHEYRGICFTDELNGIMVGYGSILKTIDGGITFTSLNNKNEYYTGICYDKIYHTIYVCDFNGSVISSIDVGASWKTIRKGSAWNTKGSYINSIDISRNNRIVCVGPNGFLTWSNDGGNSWNDRTSFDGTDILKVKWVSESTIIAVGKKGGVFLSNI